MTIYGNFDVKHQKVISSIYIIFVPIATNSLIFILYIREFVAKKQKLKKIIPIEEGDYYLTPEGYRCFTEQYHLKRGYCCESGCRHCPYGYNKKTNSLKK